MGPMGLGALGLAAFSHWSLCTQCQRQLSNNFLSPEVKRRVDKPKAGTLSQREMIELNLILDNGQTCTTLSELASGNMSLQVYQKTAELLEKLAENLVFPTVNICRQFTALKGLKFISMKSYTDFVNTMRFWPIEGENASKDTDVEFDRLEPRMYLLLPTQEDEDNLCGSDDEKPTLPKELIDYEMSKAYDCQVAEFGTWFQKCWMSDALYDLASKNVEGFKEVCTAWIMSRKDYKPCDDFKPGQKAFASADKVTEFARAYMAVAGDSCMDKVDHEAFCDFFVSTKAAYSNFKPFITACRRCDGFFAFENEAVRCASSELEFGQRFNFHIGKLVDDAANVDDNTLQEIMDLMPNYRKCRRRTYTKLQDLVIQYIILRIGEVYKDKDTADIERLERMKFLSNHAASLSPGLDPELVEQFTAAKIKAQELIEVVQEQVVLAELAEIASDKTEGRMELADPAFAHKLDCLRKLSTVPNDYWDPLLNYCCIQISGLFAALDDDEVSQAHLKTATAHFTTLTDRLWKENVKHVYPANGIAMVTLKGLKVLTAGTQYNNAKTKVNFLALNRAYLDFQTVKVGGDKEVVKDLVRGILHKNSTIKAVWYEVAKLAAIEAASELRIVTEDYMLICKGTRDGSDWKDAVPENADFVAVHSIANTPKTGLLHGPGQKVLNGRDVLVKARVAVVVITSSLHHYRHSVMIIPIALTVTRLISHEGEVYRNQVLQSVETMSDVRGYEIENQVNGMKSN